MLKKDSSELNKSMLESVLKIRGSANRMQELLNGVLQYNGIQKKQFVREKLDLNELLSNAMGVISGTSDIGRHDLVIKKLPTIQGSAEMVEFAMRHILDNSFRFRSSDRRLKISISAKQNVSLKDKPGLYTRIRFKDNGIGFRKSQANNIFQLFKRLHHQKEVAGTGIGLALTKKIMMLHDGHITAEGVIDKGAMIDLYFPEVG